MHINHKIWLIPLYCIFHLILNNCYSGINDEFQYIALNGCYGGFYVDDKAIKYLRNKYPEEKFPEEKYDYNCDNIRLNQKFCKEIQDNPGMFKIDCTSLYVSKISILALCFPSCWRIKENDGAERLEVDQEKLNLMNLNKDFSHISKIARNVAHSSSLSDEEKLDYFKNIFIPESSESESESESESDQNLYNQKRKPSVIGSYTDKIINNFPYIPNLGSEFIKAQENFYRTGLKNEIKVMVGTPVT